jgi:hypothetical protein
VLRVVDPANIRDAIDRDRHALEVEIGDLEEIGCIEVDGRRGALPRRESDVRVHGLDNIVRSDGDHGIGRLASARPSLIEARARLEGCCCRSARRRHLGRCGGCKDPDRRRRVRLRGAR